MKLNVNYIPRKERDWSKLTKELQTEKGDNIDWNYKSNFKCG